MLFYHIVNDLWGQVVIGAPVNSRTVVVLNAGVPLEMPWLDEVTAVSFHDFSLVAVCPPPPRRKRYKCRIYVKLL